MPSYRSYNPPEAGPSEVWALPRSLATNGGIIRLFSSPAGTKMLQFPAFASVLQQVRMTVLQTAGLSHSEIRGSEVICTSPRLIAAYHVLHRLWEPRHPPYALLCFLVLHLRRLAPVTAGGGGNVEYTLSSASMPDRARKRFTFAFFFRSTDGGGSCITPKIETMAISMCIKPV